MSERHQSDSQNVPNEVWEKIREIIDEIVTKSSPDAPSPEPIEVRKLAPDSVEPAYIYRGESECYAKVCSGLYRAYAQLELRNFDSPGTEESDALATLVEKSQDLVAKRAKDYLPEMEEDEDSKVLAKLQHYGGKTNLIDFTEDFLVALFFACEGAEDKDGRIILLKSNPRNTMKDNLYEVIKPPRTILRAEAQKSVLVKAPKGFLETDQYEEIPIDKGLKKAMLAYLHKHHGIYAKRIYSDIHGFIRLQDIHLPGYQEFAKGQLYEKRAIQIQEELERLEGQEGLSLKEKALADQEGIEGLKKQKQAAYDKALEHYIEALGRVKNLWDAYISRSSVHVQKEEYAEAITVCTEAIEQNPSSEPLAVIYMDRGKARNLNEDFEGAIEDFTEAIELTPEDPVAYYTRAFAYSESSCLDDDLDKAIEDYNKAIDLGPNQSLFYFERALLRFRKGQWDEALADLADARKQGSDIKDLFRLCITELPKAIMEVLTLQGNEEEG